MAKEDNIDARERLLAAGLKIFAEKGYSGSTFRDICDEAGSNIAAINYYFSDKASFYNAVQEYSRSKRRDRMERCWEVAETDPWSALRMHIEFLLDMCYDDVMFQVHWFNLRELIDIDNLPETNITPEIEQRRKCYEKHMTKLLTDLLGDAATPRNMSLLRYSYYSLCQFLPIHKQLETKFNKGTGVFNVANINRDEMVVFIFDAVKRTVEAMQEDFCKNGQQLENQKK